MIILRILWLGVLLLVIPTVVGTLFWPVVKKAHNLIFAWVCGQMALWAGFLVIAVPLVLCQQTLTLLVRLYLGYLAVLTAAAVVRLSVGRRASSLRVLEEVSAAQRREKYLLWAIFAGLLLFQLIQAVRMTYGDGDDAYYVAVANLAEESDTMYLKSAYSGGVESLDVRYGLAPFPLWLAFLARVSGVRTVSVAHVIVPPVLISMTYAIYYLLGSRLFAKNRERLPLFLIFAELLVIFGDYSIYTAESFMIARSRQGKAALGNIVIPMLFYLLYLLLERLQERQKVPVGYWVLLCCTQAVACLCSTLGALLTCMLVGVVGLCTAICYRKWKVLFPLAACCIPCVAVAVLYVSL